MPIVSSKEKTNEAVRLISQFQTGNVTPLYMGDDPLFRWLSGIMVADLLPGTILTIGGLSNHGKTHFLQRLENNIIKSNKDVVLLRCNWESNVYKLLSRTIVMETKISMKELLLNEPKGTLKDSIKEICDRERQEGLFYYEDSVDATQFIKDVGDFLAAHIDKKVVISIDHVGLVKGREKSAIDALFEAMNYLKKQHPYVVFIPLMQLERSKLLNRLGDHYKEAPNRSDFYGSDQLFQVSDGVIVVYNPYRERQQEKYMKFLKGGFSYIDDSFKIGSDKYEHFDAEGNIFYHAVKARDINDMENFQSVFVESIYKVKKEKPKELSTDDVLDF